MADAGLEAVLSPEEKESLRPEKENAISWFVFWPEELFLMAVSANYDEPHLRNTAESWADNAEFRNGRRLPHNFENFSSNYRLGLLEKSHAWCRSCRFIEEARSNRFTKSRAAGGRVRPILRGLAPRTGF